MITPFRRITFADAMLKYGTDKPDLRIPIEISDVTETFRGSGFSIFANAIEKGSVVRAVPGPGCGSRSVADRMNAWAQGEGAPGMGYIIFGEGEARGPVAKALGEDKALALKAELGLADGDAVFFACAAEADAASLAGKARVRIGDERELRTGGAELLDCRFPDVRKRRNHGSDHFLAPPVFDAAGRSRCAREHGPAGDQGVAV